MDNNRRLLCVEIILFMIILKIPKLTDWKQTLYIYILRIWMRLEKLIFLIPERCLTYAQEVQQTWNLYVMAPQTLGKAIHKY